MFAGLLTTLTSKLIAGGIALLLVTGAVTWWTTHWYNKGWYAHEALVEQRNKEAVDAGTRNDDAAIACDKSGGVWDTTSGECRR